MYILCVLHISITRIIKYFKECYKIGSKDLIYVDNIFNINYN